MANKPTIEELREFRDWLTSQGFETDRDRTHYFLSTPYVRLHLSLMFTLKHEFKQIEASVEFLFTDYRFRQVNTEFKPCKTLSAPYVSACIGVLNSISNDTAEYFKTVEDLISKVNPKEYKK